MDSGKYKDALLELCSRAQGHVGRTSKEEEGGGCPPKEKEHVDFYFLLKNPLHHPS